MKKIFEVLGVFIVGVVAVIMNVAAQDAKPSVDSVPEPTPQVASSPAASSPYARVVDCPICGGGFRVVGKEPFEQIACECGATLNVAEDEGGSLAASAVEPKLEEVAEIVTDEPEKTPEIADAPKEINWLTDQEEAKAEAVRTGKPLLVFGTKSFGCPPCERVKKYVFGDPRVVERLNKDFVCCLVVDRAIHTGLNVPFPSMWLRLPSGAGFLWYAPRHAVPEEPMAFLEALDRKLGR